MKTKDYYLIRCAADYSIALLKNSRDSLQRAGAANAAKATSRALKSVEGARRHAERMLNAEAAQCEHKWANKTGLIVCQRCGEER
jgi:hypothetical protein